MRAIEYVDVAEEINRCLERANFELQKVREALRMYKLDYGTHEELEAITEAIHSCKVTERVEDYEDDTLFS